MEVVPIPTSVVKPTRTSFLAKGLCMILSIVIILLEVATVGSTAKLCVFPIPVVEVKLTDVPTKDSLDPIANLILSLVTFIANTLVGNMFVVPIPIAKELVAAIPIALPLFWESFVGEYTNSSPVLKLWSIIVISLFEILDGLNVCKNALFPSIVNVKVVSPTNWLFVFSICPVNCGLISSKIKTLLVLDSL